MYALKCDVFCSAGLVDALVVAAGCGAVESMAFSACDNVTTIISASLAICEGNPMVPPHKEPDTQSFDVFFDSSLNKELSKQQITDDFRRQDVHMTSL